MVRHASARYGGSLISSSFRRLRDPPLRECQSLEDVSSGDFCKRRVGMIMTGGPFSFVRTTVVTAASSSSVIGVIGSLKCHVCITGCGDTYIIYHLSYMSINQEDSMWFCP
jgi:hypothetical protein